VSNISTARRTAAFLLVDRHQTSLGCVEQACTQSEAMIIQKGLERFERCLDLNRNGHCDRNRRGKFGADYIYWATFNPRTDRLIKG
jgi:hypothetical protein